MRRELVPLRQIRRRGLVIRLRGLHPIPCLALDGQLRDIRWREPDVPRRHLGRAEQYDRTPQERSFAIAAATKLIELENAADSMSLDDICARYQSFEWDVLEQLNSDTGLFTTEKSNWSKKGVRHFLALLELLEFLVPELEIQTRGAS